MYLNGPWLIVSIAILQVLLAVRLFSAHRSGVKERKELAGLLLDITDRIERAAASTDEAIARTYQRILSRAAAEVPRSVASRMGDRLFEVESLILRQLAELQPGFAQDPIRKAKMDEIIRRVESLEDLIVAAASESVQEAILAERYKTADFAPSLCGADALSEGPEPVTLPAPMVLRR